MIKTAITELNNNSSTSRRNDRLKRDAIYTYRCENPIQKTLHLITGCRKSDRRQTFFNCEGPDVILDDGIGVAVRELGELGGKARHISKMDIVTKLWGSEFIFHVQDPKQYTLKQLNVMASPVQCSIHYHIKKTEIFVVTSGTLILETWPVLKSEKDFDIKNVSTRVLQPFECVELPVMTPHRFYSPHGVGARFIELSTPDDPKDSKRLVRSGSYAFTENKREVVHGVFI